MNLITCATKSVTQKVAPSIGDDIVTFHSYLPKSGALLALDFGLKRIGIATSTSQRSLAVALPVLHRKNRKEDFIFLRELFNERRAVGWVLGLPLSQSGKESSMSLKVRHFAVKLVAAQQPQAPMLLFDERFTSRLVVHAKYEEIGSKIKKSANSAIDSAVATLLLQNCLEALKNC